MDQSFAKLTLVITCLLLVPVSLVAEQAQTLEQLIEQYGKPALTEVIQQQRFGEITIDNNGNLSDQYGRPNASMITPRSLASDLEKLGWDVNKLADSVRQSVQKDEQEQASRKQYQQNKALEEKSSEGYSATFESHIRVDDGSPRPKSSPTKIDQCLQSCDTKFKSCLGSDKARHQCVSDVKLVCEKSCY